LSVQWHLKSYIRTKHNILKLTDFQKLLVRETGVRISIQHLSNLINRKPASIKLSTIEIICTGLNCNLSDFCEIKHSSPLAKKKTKLRKLSFQTTPHQKKIQNSFPDPNDYE